MKKLVLGAAIAASLTAGAVAAVASPIPLALAKGATGQNQPDPNKPERGAHNPRVEALDQLVKDGMITEEQKNQILDRMKKFSRRPGQFIEHSRKAVAAAIGISVEELRGARQGGKSFADVAREHGVDPQKVIDTLVANATKRVDDAVAAHELPADRAAKIKSRLPELVAHWINAKKSAKGDGHAKRDKGAQRPKAGNEPQSTTTTPPSSAPSPGAESPGSSAPPTSSSTATPSGSAPSTTAAAGAAESQTTSTSPPDTGRSTTGGTASAAGEGS